MADSRRAHEWLLASTQITWMASVHGMEVDRKIIDPYAGDEIEPGPRVTVKPSMMAERLAKKKRRPQGRKT